MTRRLMVMFACGMIALTPVLSFGQSSRPTTTMDIKASIIRQDEGTAYTGGLEFDIRSEYEYRKGDKDFAWRKSLRALFKADGLLTGDKDHNARPLRAELTAGGSLNMSGPKISELGPNPGEETVTQQPFNYGRLNAGLNAGYETDQALDNRNATAGGELAYVLIENRGWKALVPSVYAQYEWVTVGKSELQQDAAVDDDGYQRYRVAASWKMPVGDHLPGALQPLQLHLDVRYYRDLNRPEAIGQAGLDESRYVAGALSYVFREPLVKGTVSGVFLKASRGRIPPAVDKNMDVYLGVILWEK